MTTTTTATTTAKTCHLRLKHLPRNRAQLTSHLDFNDIDKRFEGMQGGGESDIMGGGVEGWR